MKILLAILFCVLFTTIAFASSNILNKDMRSCKLLFGNSPSCFAGTNTSINGNTSMSVSSDWVCLDEKNQPLNLKMVNHILLKMGKFNVSKISNF